MVVSTLTSFFALATHVLLRNASWYSFFSIGNSPLTVSVVRESQMLVFALSKSSSAFTKRRRNAALFHRSAKEARNDVDVSPV